MVLAPTSFWWLELLATRFASIAFQPSEALSLTLKAKMLDLAARQEASAQESDKGVPYVHCTVRTYGTQAQAQGDRIGTYVAHLHKGFTLAKNISH